MRKFIPILGLVLTILWMLLIFYFSSKTSNEVDAEKIGLLRFVVNIFHGDKFNTYSELKKQQILNDYSFYLSKTAHFIEYGILCFFCYLMLIHLKKYRINYIISLVICIFYAISDEYHQTFSSGRTPRVEDVIIDSMGALTMLIIIELIMTIVFIVKVGKKHD